jgi:flagellar basal-body rod modification protein FlgD
MGSLIATVNDDGTLQTQTTSGDSLSTSTKSSNNTVDSDTFLTLLVAEMQNQDPLEPTSNTEWVAQYAQFTQVETMNEMSESMDLLRANSLVGKDVIMKVTSASTGDVTYASGTVDYIEVENGKPILVIGGNQYSLSDLDTVISDDYSTAYDLYTEFKANISSLPDVKYADTSYADKITSLYDQYNFEMDDYQKNFMTTYASSELDTLANWVSALSKLGVEFKTEAEHETTLDDIWESFNTKMDAIMKQIDRLEEQVTAQTQVAQTQAVATSNIANAVASSNTSSSSSSDTAEATNGTEDSADNNNAITDEQLDALTASGTDKASNSSNVEDTTQPDTDNNGSGDNVGEVSEEAKQAEASEEAASTEKTSDTSETKGEASEGEEAVVDTDV